MTFFAVSKSKRIFSFGPSLVHETFEHPGSFCKSDGWEELQDCQNAHFRSFGLI
jgi:hypothetical protein